MERMRRSWSLALLGMTVALLFCQNSAAHAADVYDGQRQVVIEKATEDDIPRLIDLLGDKDPMVRQTARASLAAFGPKAAPALIEAMDKGKNRQQVIGILADMKDPGAMAPMYKYVDDKDNVVRDQSRAWLIYMGEASVPFLLDKFEANDKREAATNMLLNIDMTAATEKRLRKMLSSPDPDLRASSVYILGEKKDKGSAKDVEALLNDKDVRVREKAVVAYWKMTEDYDPHALIPLLKDESALVRARAAELIGLAKNPDPALVVPPLMEAAKKEKDSEARGQALQALGRLKASGSIVLMLEALDDPDLLVRDYALCGLGEIQDPIAVPYIVNLFKEKKIHERLIIPACIALETIGMPLDLQVFYPYLDEAHGYGPIEHLLRMIEKFVTDANRKQTLDVLEKFYGKLPDGNMKTSVAGAIKKIRE